MDWWKEVDDNWDNLLCLISKFHPSMRNEEQIMLDYPITAVNAERACESVRKSIKLSNPVADAIKAKNQRDHNALNIIFNHTWFGAPESRNVFAEPRFALLCDLCSEQPE